MKKNNLYAITIAVDDNTMHTVEVVLPQPLAVQAGIGNVDAREAVVDQMLVTHPDTLAFCEEHFDDDDGRALWRKVWDHVALFNTLRIDA